MKTISKDDFIGLPRRDFLKITGVAGTGMLFGTGLIEEAGVLPSDKLSKPRKEIPNIRLSDSGGDRATAYVMSNKIVKWNQDYLCTWIDVERVNHWALIDANSGKIFNQGVIGEAMRDNHCGAVLAVEPDKSVHLITGGHHTPFVHYRLHAKNRDIDWQMVDTLEVDGTYPALISDLNGRLHLTYRVSGTTNWTLNYCHYTKDSGWSVPREIIRASIEGYVYWTNGLSLGKDGHIHLVFGNAQPLENGAVYYGASHIFSKDGGNSWRQFGRNQHLAEPAETKDLLRIEGNSLLPERMLSGEEIEANKDPGPYNYLYHNMNLSNPVVDPSNRVWVIVHNRMQGTAHLYFYNNGAWESLPLLQIVQHFLPGYTIHPHSTLSMHANGFMEGIVMASPPGDPGYGAIGTELIRFIFDSDGKLYKKEKVHGQNKKFAFWQPGLAQWNWFSAFPEPALVFTKGSNAGGFSNNVSNLKAEVFIQIPSMG